jgi:hypothetical protein
MEPISDIQSKFSIKRKSILINKVKEEPKDNEMKSISEEVEVKVEEKFSETVEFANYTSIQTTSIGFMIEETTEETTSSDDDDNSTNQT